MKTECWLCVDKDGTEKITNSRPIRRQYKGLRIISALWGMCTGHYSKNGWDRWCNGFSSDSNDFLPFLGVELPKGLLRS